MHRQFRGAGHRHSLAEQDLRKQGLRRVELSRNVPRNVRHRCRMGSVQRIAYKEGPESGHRASMRQCLDKPKEAVIA
jgi:hypothetical protein